MSLSTHTPTRIFVLRSGAVGDFILTTPVIASLRHAYPDAHITVVGRPDRICLASHITDSLLDIDDSVWASLFSADPSDELRELLRETDLTVSYLPDRDGVLLRNLTDLTSGPVATLSPHPPDDGSLHIVDHLLSALRPLGIDTRRQPTVSDADSGIPAPFAVVHPGSGGQHKIWPAERFVEVASELSAYGQIGVTSGPGDESILDPIRHALPDAQFVPTLGLPEFAGLLNSAHVFIGNDSGPSHLAAAVGTPTVAIFGPTDPRTWGPVGENVRIIAPPSGNALDAVSVSTVVNAAKQLISL